MARLRVRLGRDEPAAATGSRAPRRAFDWAGVAEHCRLAWLRGRFLARGSLSLAGGRTHLEFVVDRDEAPVLAERLADVRAAGLVAAPARPRASSPGRTGTPSARSCGGSGRPAALLELEARQVSRALRGELNRVLNAESANLQRAVSAAGRQLGAIDDARGRRPARTSSRTSSGSVAEARRETPEATLAELAERLDLHRSAVQRALERIERLASTPPDGGTAAADAGSRATRRRDRAPLA